jgi:PII-like signaling protein
MHFSEQDRYENAPLHEAIAESCYRLGIAGITIFRGLEGYGESAELHRSNLFHRNQPLVVTIVDSPEQIERLMPELRRMIDTGIIAISDVEMIRIERDRAPGTHM